MAWFFSFDTWLSSLSTKDNTRRILIVFREGFKVLLLENIVFVHSVQIVKATLSIFSHFPYSSQQLHKLVEEHFSIHPLLKIVFEAKKLLNVNWPKNYWEVFCLILRYMDDFLSYLTLINSYFDSVVIREYTSYNLDSFKFIEVLWSNLMTVPGEPEKMYIFQWLSLFLYTIN